jgi:hypothetical protein
LIVQVGQRSLTPSNAAKVEAHSEHLLDGFRALRARYALQHPMLYSEKVAADRGSGKQASGFRTLRSSLFLTCAQDIAKFAADRALVRRACATPRLHFVTTT